MDTPEWSIEQEFLHNVWPACEKVHGWMSPGQLFALYALAKQVPPTGCIVEIGAWQGRSSIALAWFGRTTFSIDPWDCSGGGQYKWFKGNLFETWQENTRNAGVSPIPLVGTSEQVNRTWTEAIDLLFIDGDHSYAAVKKDFTQWSPFLKPGGTIVFDDCSEAGPYRAIRLGLQDGSDWTDGLVIENKLFITKKKESK